MPPQQDITQNSIKRFDTNYLFQMQLSFVIYIYHIRNFFIKLYHKYTLYQKFIYEITSLNMNDIGV